MKLKKVAKIQLIRYLVQALSLIFIPSIFILTYSNVKNLYIGIVTGNEDIHIMLPALLNVIIVVGISAVLGRFFCGWMCSFGTFMDIIYFISNKIFKIKFNVPEKVDRILKYTKHVILFGSIIFVWTFQSEFLNNKDPWDAFAQFPNFHSMIFNNTLAFIFLVFIILGAMFVERFFCRYLCPLGAIFKITSKFRIFKINKPSEKCGKCRICTNNCLMGINMYKEDKIRDSECIDCFKCVTVCPRKNIDVKVSQKSVASALVALVTVSSIVALNEGAKIVDNRINPQIHFVKPVTSVKIKSLKISNENGLYKDGNYEGEATGFRPGDKVEVVIENGKIQNIGVMASNDTPSFFYRAYSVIVPEIIKAQNANVDTVSGATFSSRGIINATKKALEKAKN